MSKAGKSRNILSDTELLAYSKEHVFYEITMLVEAADLLNYTVDTPSGPMEPPFHNAALESFAIHVRNLVDFLYPGPNIKPSDVLADDFFPQQKRPADFPEISDMLGIARRRAHKELSHLTTDRLPEGHPEKGWNTVELLREIFKVLAIFAQHAAPTKLHDNVREFVIRNNAAPGAPLTPQGPSGQRD
jgi:hypothetical protein